MQVNIVHVFLKNVNIVISYAQKRLYYISIGYTIILCSGGKDMKRLLAAILAVAMLLPVMTYAAVATPDTSGETFIQTTVVYENEFDSDDGEAVKWKPRDNRTHDNSSIKITDGALVVEQTGSVGSTLWYERTLDEPLSGTVVVSFDMKITNSGDNPAFFIIRGKGGENIVQFDWRKSQIGFNMSSGWVGAVSAAENVYTNVKFVINTDAKTLDMYVDDKLISSGRAFRESAGEVASIQVGPYGGATQTIYLDNLTVAIQEEVEAGKQVYSNTFDSDDDISGWKLKGSNSTDKLSVTVDEGRMAITQSDRVSGSSNWYIYDLGESSTKENTVTVTATMALDKALPTRLNAAFFFVYQGDKMIAQVDLRNSGKDYNTISLNDKVNDAGNYNYLEITDVTQPIDIKIVIDFESDTYDFYANDVLLYENTGFKDSGFDGSSVTRIGAGFQSGVSSATLYIDDISIIDGPVPPETEEPDDGDTEEPDPQTPVAASSNKSAKYVYLNEELHAMVVNRRFIASYHIIGDDGVCALCKGVVSSFEPDDTPAPENAVFCERFNTYDATDSWSLIKGADQKIKIAVRDGEAAITQTDAPGSSNWYVVDTPVTSSNIVTVEADISLGGEFSANYNAAFFIVYGTDSKMIAQVDYRLANGEHRISLNDHYEEKYVVVDDVTQMHNVKVVIDFDTDSYDFYVDDELLFAGLSFKDGSTANAVGQVGAGLQGAVKNMTMYVDNIVITEGGTMSSDGSSQADEARIEIDAADALDNSADAWTVTEGSDEWVPTDDGVSIQPDTKRKWENTSENLEGAPSLNYKIDVETEGAYYVYVNMSAPDADSDSYHVMVDGEYVYTHSVGDMSGDKVWKSAGKEIELSAGEHTITIVPREDGFVINKIVLTTDKNARFTDGTI